MNRLWTLLALCLLAVGCRTAVPPSPVTLKIGVIDPICRKSACSCVSDAAKRSFEGMNAKLAQEGIVLEMEYFEDPPLLARALNAGRLDGMIGKVTTCGRYARVANRDFVRLADIAKPTGETGLRGVFITLKDSPVKSLADLPGHTLGLGYPEDTEKVDLALATLKSRGLEVPEAQRQKFFDCKSAALALLEKRVEVAVISDYALEYGCIVVVGAPEDFRVIAQTDDCLPFTSLLVDTQRVPAAARARITAALLAIRGQQVPEDLFSTGWFEPKPWPADYRQP